MEKLGINGGLLLAQIINFLVVAAILYFGMWKFLVRALEARREKIAKGLEDAAAAEVARANAERDAAKILDQRRTEANKLIEEGRVRGEEQAKAVLDDARREAEEIRSRARAEAEEERNAILGEVRSQVGQLALAAAERVIGQSLDSGKSQAIINDFFAKAPAEARGLGDSVEVTSALPLSDSEKNSVKQQLGASSVTFKVDPGILGGLVLRSGERLVDGSVRSNLQGLAAQMR